MPLAIQLDDDAYAVAKAFAEKAHCSLSSAVNKLVVSSGMGGGKRERTQGNSTIRFPLAHGAKPITADDVKRLEDDT